MKKTAVIRIVVFSVLIFVLVFILAAVLGADRLPFGWGKYLKPHRKIEGEILSNQTGELLEVSAQSIRKLQVEWVSGQVILEPGDVDQIQIQESRSEEPMVCAVDGDTLNIYFEEQSSFQFGVFTKDLSKDLHIVVPRQWKDHSVEIRSVSADVQVGDMVLSALEFEGVSGKLDINHSDVQKMSLETVSGKVTLDGQVQELSCESVSADCELNLTNVPREISMEGVSGKLDLVLPRDAGFTAELEGLSKDFDTDFPTSRRDDRYICGDGSCRISIEGVSGKASIRMADAR